MQTQVQMQAQAVLNHYAALPAQQLKILLTTYNLMSIKNWTLSQLMLIYYLLQIITNSIPSTKSISIKSKPPAV